MTHKLKIVINLNYYEQKYKFNNKKLYYIILFSLNWIRSILKIKSEIQFNPRNF